MEKLIITAAVNGSSTPRSKNPSIPYSPDEIAQSVYECWNAGASIAHIHARNSDGTPSYSAAVYEEIVSRIRDRCDIVINLSTSGLNLPPGLPRSEAWNHLNLYPDMATFNCGSVNHGGKAFVNPPALARELAVDLRKFSVKPEIEIYHGGIIDEALAFKEEGLLDSPLYFTFALGIRGSVAASCKNLLHLTESIPAGSIWSANAIGKYQLPINVHTILLGGHVRTGLEDNVYFKTRELATGNAQLVERIVQLSLSFGRDIASPVETRRTLKISEVSKVSELERA